MIESQSSICSWADATFGPSVSDASIAADALTAMAELVTACVNGEPAERIGEEIADVVIVLARLGRSLGVDVIGMVNVAQVALAGDESDPAVEAADALAQLATTLMRLLVGGRAFIGSVVATLASVSLNAGISLPAAIDAKMATNRARKWVLDGNGHGRHVES